MSLGSDERGPLVVGLSVRTAPLRVIERASLDSLAAVRLLRALRATQAVDEALVLSTCNRTELYLVPRGPGRSDTIKLIGELLTQHTDVCERELAELGYVYSDDAAVEHFLGVVAGLDSAVLGESEIVGQVRAAVELARKEGTLDRLLERLCSHALAAGRRIRAKTAISRGAISFPSIAVDLARTLLGDLCNRRALVVGAGKIGRTAARQLASGGAYVVVANRSPGAAKRIAHEVAGHETGLGALGEELRVADVAVCATGAPSYLLPRRMLAHVTDQRDIPLVVIDVAMPRDVEPTANDLPAVTLRDIDDIHRIAERNLHERRAELPRAWAIVRAEAERFRTWRMSLAVSRCSRT